MRAGKASAGLVAAAVLSAAPALFSTESQAQSFRFTPCSVCSSGCPSMCQPPRRDDYYISPAPTVRPGELALQQARKLTEAGRCEEALPLINEGLAAWPENADGWEDFATCLRRTAGPEALIQELTHFRKRYMPPGAISRELDREIAEARNRLYRPKLESAQRQEQNSRDQSTREAIGLAELHTQRAEDEARASDAGRADRDAKRLEEENRAYELKRLERSRKRGDPVTKGGRPFVHEEKGFIGGTTWQYGYSVPHALALDPAKRAEAMRKLEAQLRVHEVDPSRFVDPTQYAFLIGVAASHKPVTDLALRVFWDNLSSGGATPELQSMYGRIAGRRFETLDCHSNGTMVCLAGLRRGDVQAGKVRLFGPQVTPDSIALWEELLKRKQIRAVEIYLNNGDPIPLVAYLTGFINAPGSFTSRILGGLRLGLDEALGGDGIAKAIKRQSSYVRVHEMRCNDSLLGSHAVYKYSLKCHEAGPYQMYAETH